MSAQNDAQQDLTALEKHACAACGAQAVWTPARQALICEYCGTLAPVELDKDTESVREIDLVQTLREMPEELRGWKTQTKSVQCRSCRAISVFQAERVGQRCDFCGSSELVDYEEIKSPIRPQSVLPFKVDKTTVRERIRRWYSSKWFAPNALKKKAVLDGVHGVYMPYWTFDAAVECDWTAMAGHYYYVQESYRDSKGRRRSRSVRKTRWVPAAGHLSHFFDDEPIPGTQGIDRELLAQIEPFPYQELIPYDTAYLSGFVVEHYRVVLIEAAKKAREAMLNKLRGLCGAQVPGDTYRALQIDPQFDGQTFKHVLVPVWLLSYRYGGKAFQVLVNGHTGEIAGRYPKSFWKIFFAVSGALFLLLLILAARACAG